RIKRLVKEDIIKKFTILPNFSLLGCSWYTLVIEMKTFEKKEEMKFKEFVRNHLYITSAEKTLGPWDVIVYIIADNPKNFHKTIKQIKTEFPTMVRSYDTFIAYREHAFYPFPKILTNKTGIPSKNTHQNI
ncbi:MAG: Lrp/AsnC family transcriptional regulator, partial [Candidatus Woesearchaeota archaeon]|nr:Lrp/AsnC family transcriptional regulator [Candidatus Woesearchaeota archaeon]